MAGTGSDVSPGIKGRFKAATDLQSRVDSGVTQVIVYKLDTIVELMRELRQSLEFQITEEGVSVYSRVQGAIDEMIHHVDGQITTLFNEFQKHKEAYQQHLDQSVEFFGADVQTQQKSLITITTRLTKLQNSSSVESDMLDRVTNMLYHAQDTFEETADFITAFLRDNSNGKFSVPTQAGGAWIPDLPKYYAGDPNLRRHCINRTDLVLTSVANSTVRKCDFTFNLTEGKVLGVNESVECLDLQAQENLIRELGEIKNCYLDYSNTLDEIEERYSIRSEGAKFLMDKRPLQEMAFSLAKGQNSIDELAKNYVGNLSQLSDLAEFVSNESSKYFKHFQGAGIAESVTKNAAEPLLKYAAEQQQLLLTQLEGALQDHLLLYDYVENDTLTAVARRLEIWLKPIPNLELDQVDIILLNQ